MTRSLVIAPQWIGDAVMTEPLIRALAGQNRADDIKLVVAALPWVAPIYRAMHNVTDVIELPFAHGRLDWSARWALGLSLKGQFDRAIVLPNSLKSALLPWFAGIPERIGYAGELRYGLLNKRLQNPPRDQRGFMVEHYLALIALTGPQPAFELQKVPRLSIKASAVNTAVQTHGLAIDGYTLLVPGAEFGSAKRWPSEYFATLAKQLLTAGQSVVLLGSAKEAALCESIRNSASPDVINLAGKTDLAEAIALIAACRQMVSNDSGLMHVAAAFSKPQVAIFGSSNPHHPPPISLEAKVLWLKDLNGLDCAPCYQRECPKTGDENLKCLRAITPERVAKALSIG